MHFNSANRPVSASDASNNYAQSAVYYAPGELNTLTEGVNGSYDIVLTQTFTNRLQPVMVQLSSPSWTNCLVLNYYSSGVTNPPTSCATPSQGTGNNGNVMGYFFTDPYLGHPNAFTYDSLNRLSTAQATGTNPANYDWTYSYDRYGNMQCSGSTGGQDTCPSMSYSATTNQLTAIGTQTPQYDAAGNLSQDGGTGVTGTHSYTWDAEGRMSSVGSPAGTTVATYTYNALGQRAEKNVNSGMYTEYVHDAGGNVVATSNRSAWVEEFFPLGGRIFAKYANGVTYFMHSNALGSTGTITDQAGHWVDAEIYDPWGQRWATYGTPYDERFAASQERDGESGLDPTPNRMLTSQYGRWLTPDPLAGDITNPQSLNRYAYVTDNPTRFTDQLGLSPRAACLWQIRPPRRRNSLPGACGGIYDGGGGGGVSIDGGSADGGSVEGYQWQVAGIDPWTGQPAILEPEAGAGGAVGWLSAYDISQGLNEVNGTFFSDAAYQAYVRGNFLDAINAQLAAIVGALEARGATSEQIQAFENYISQNFSDIVVKGGNADFSTSGPGFDFFAQFASACPDERCDLGSIGTLDFSHEDGSFHLDTADPYNFPAGTLLHLGVDLFLGNVAYTVIPRH